MNKYMRAFFMSCCVLSVLNCVGCASAQNAPRVIVSEQEQHRQVIDKAENKFTYVAQKSIFFSGGKRVMEQGNAYTGIPYSSRWKNAHFVGFEISPETAANAANDELSIWYDLSEETNIGEIHSVKFGPGYGLVCSAYVSLMLGNPYPQTNYGMLYDKNFVLERSEALNLVADNYYMHTSYGHSIYVKDVTSTSYILSECTSPSVQQTSHNKLVNKLSNYKIKVNNIDKSGYNNYYLNCDNYKLANGSIRPWRGNKAVYGNWDLNNSRVLLTIHGNVKEVYLNMPDGQTKSFAVERQQKYLDVTDYITQNGTYEISSDISATKEYFRFYNTPMVELSFLPDGTAVFNDDKVDYCYLLYTREDEKKWPVVIAKGVKYPEIARNKDRITTVYAAMKRDPEQDSWGRYSNLCRLIK